MQILIPNMILQWLISSFGYLDLFSYSNNRFAQRYDQLTYTNAYDEYLGLYKLNEVNQSHLKIKNSKYSVFSLTNLEKDFKYLSNEAKRRILNAFPNRQ